MKARSQVFVGGASLVVVAMGGLLFLQLQFAFVNAGQEFGAFGQYNRVLRVIRAMDDFAVIGHGVSRKLELGHLSQVEAFSIKLRARNGQAAEIRFEKGTAEMVQRNDGVLRDIVRSKFSQALLHPGKN